MTGVMTALYLLTEYYLFSPKSSVMHHADHAGGILHKTHISASWACAEQRMTAGQSCLFAATESEAGKEGLQELVLILQLLKNCVGSFQVGIPDHGVCILAVAPAPGLDKDRLLLHDPLDGLYLLQELRPAPASQRAYIHTAVKDYRFKDHTQSQEPLQALYSQSKSCGLRCAKWCMDDVATCAHLCAQRSLCRLLNCLAILTREVLAQLLIQFFLFNIAPVTRALHWILQLPSALSMQS